jgi:hypothetical protein
MSHKITADELQMLEAAQNGDQWRLACLQIKQARGGVYPSDWWPTVKQSGLMDRVLARFGETSDIKVS